MKKGEHEGPIPIGYVFGMAARQLINAGADPADLARARNRARYRYLPRTQELLQGTWKTMVMALWSGQRQVVEEVSA